MANRSDVYAAIDSERDYQSRLQRNGQATQISQGKGRHWAMDLVTIDEIIQHIKTYAYNNAGDPPMDYFRKLAAVAVHTMETYGAPKRVIKEQE